MSTETAACSSRMKQVVLHQKAEAVNNRQPYNNTHSQRSQYRTDRSLSYGYISNITNYLLSVYLASSPSVGK